MTFTPDMRKPIIVSLSASTLLILAILTIYLLINLSVNKNIEIAQHTYGGSPEDALISYLLDQNNSTVDRTHKAIWTLGQIKAEQALPLLQDLFLNDPEGSTCFGKHDSMLCQYELHKAISSIESNSKLFSF